MATYYVDATNGNDSNNGTSPESAWKTISKVNSSSFSPGDSILFKKGETWAERLIVPSSGSAGNPITFSDYGEGELPLFYGATQVTGWTGPNGDGVYTKSVSSANVVWEDSVPLRKATDQTCSDGNWYYSSGTLYYKPTSGVPNDHLVEIEISSSPMFDLNAKNYLNISNIRFEKACHAVGMYRSSYTSSWGSVIIDNCVALNSRDGVVIRIYLDQNGSISPIIIRNCSAYYCSRSIAVMGFGCETNVQGFSGVKVYNNEVYYGSQCYGADYSWYSALGYVMTGIEFQNISNSEVYTNYVTGNYCRGIYLYICAGGTVKDNKIYRNYVSVGRCGIIAAGAAAGYEYSGNQIYYNLLINCGANEASSTYKTGLYLGNVTTPVSAYNYVYNNTIVNSNTQGIYIAGDYWKIKNNIIYGSGTYHIYNNSTSTNFEFDYNDFYPDGSYYRRTTTTYNSLEAWKSGTGQDANSIASDPLFKNADAGNFRLQVSSPAINAGTDVGLTEDFEGTPIPSGSNPCIGAYQFIPEGSEMFLTTKIII